jgi:hypothetical protein
VFLVLQDSICPDVFGVVSLCVIRYSYVPTSLSHITSKYKQHLIGSEDIQEIKIIICLIICLSNSNVHFILLYLVMERFSVGPNFFFFFLVFELVKTKTFL